MILALLSLLSLFASVAGSPIDDYVWRYDENYKWVDMGPEWELSGRSIDGVHSWHSYTLNLTSQKWLEDSDYSPSSEGKAIWWHMLVVIVPSEIKWKQNGTLWITGHGMGYRPTSNKDEDIALAAALAMGVGTITGVLFQVPNEDITFAADPIQMSRGEDEIIAFTWDHYLKDTSQPDWLVRFPMIKASIRALDAITEFVAKSHPELDCQLNYYAISGASKRGWTTWLGLVDPARVVAIVPIVLDAINFVEVEHHHYRSYGGWSFALNDYYEMNIMTRLDTPEMRSLQEQEDPFFFRERLTMPKLIVNAALDEFQQPDDTHYWWNQMPEPKRFLMTPNADHSEATGILEIVPAIGTWLEYLLQKATVPNFTWTISEETGEIVATLDHVGKVHKASVWYAYSCGTNAVDGVQRRDFRLMSLDNPCTCGVQSGDNCLNMKSMWTDQELQVSFVNGKRTYKTQLPAPEDGRWIAYFIEIKYEKVEFPAEKVKGLPYDKPGQLVFTTEVSVWPNTFPYEECQGEGCHGYLL